MGFSNSGMMAGTNGTDGTNGTNGADGADGADGLFANFTIHTGGPGTIAPGGHLFTVSGNNDKTLSAAAAAGSAWALLARGDADGNLVLGTSGSTITLSAFPFSLVVRDSTGFVVAKWNTSGVLSIAHVNS